MARKTQSAKSVSEPVSKSDATPEEVAAYVDLSFTTAGGIDSAIAVLNVLSINPDTSADELRYVEFELGDQIAKKARVFSLLNAFIANQRAMLPPTDEMISSAKKLAKVLYELTAASAKAQQIVVTSTQLFKLWQKTEA